MLGNKRRPAWALKQKCKGLFFLKNSWTSWHGSPTVSVRKFHKFHKSKVTSSISQMLYASSWRNSLCFLFGLKKKKSHSEKVYKVMSTYTSESLISSLLDSEHKICLYHYKCWLEERRQISPILLMVYLLYFIRSLALLVISMPLWYVFS